MKTAKKGLQPKKNQAQIRSEAGILILPEYFFAPAKQSVMRFTYQVRNFFLPVAENGYRPHFHHPRHLSTFGATLIAFKILMAGLVFAAPTQAFMMSDTLEGQKAGVIAQTNILRSSQGLNTLTTNSTLAASAQAKAEDMAANQYFGHAGPTGNRLAYWLGKYGYKYSIAGENLAMGFDSAQAAMNGWIASPTHYANLVESRYTEFGVGIASGTYEGKPTVFIVQHFGAPKVVPSSQPQVTTPKTELIKAEPLPGISTAEASAVTTSSNPINQPIHYDASQSRVTWSEAGDKVTVSASAKITGPAAGVTVLVGSMPIELSYDKATDRYIGQVETANTNSNVSSALTVPTIQIKSSHGQVMTDSIDWAAVKTLSQDPVAHALDLAAKETKPWLPIELLHWIIIGGLIGLAASLLLQIWVAWKEKKPIIGAELVGMFIIIVGLAAI